MTDADLLELIKSVDPMAVRIPPGIRAIAEVLLGARDAERTDAQIDAAIVAWFEYSKEYGPDDYRARMRAAIAAAQTKLESQ